MADISKCAGTDCPSKETCYRFTARSSKFWQSWFSNVPYDHAAGWCKEYWETEAKNETKNNTAA